MTQPAALSDTADPASSQLPRRVLVIDDEQVICHSCSRSLGKSGYEVVTCTSPKRGLELAQRECFDIILLDIIMPQMGGVEVLRELRANGVESEVVIITGYADVGTAVEVMKLGATDYLAKPFSPAELRHVVGRVAERSSLIRENMALRQELAQQQDFHGMVGESRGMQRVYNLVRRVAGSDGTVLITGDSGTGKEMVARAIHELSERAGGPFLACDCSALAPSLLESELFGHVKGSFTGAMSTKRGLFEVSSGGTLFLDEVSNISMETQGKLLRALESRRIKRVGDTQERALDIRLVAATNRNLHEMIRAGEFREDLFYRLNVVPIDLPPLRERDGDIPRLVAAFLDAFRAHGPTLVRGFTPEAIAVMEAYDWPGNVRELKNIVDRMAILCESEQVRPEHLPAEFGGQSARARMVELPETWDQLKSHKRQLQDDVVRDIEQEFLRRALERAHGNVSRAAAFVGMQRTNFHALMRKHGISSREAWGSEPQRR